LKPVQQPRHSGDVSALAPDPSLLAPCASWFDPAALSSGLASLTDRPTPATLERWRQLVSQGPRVLRRDHWLPGHITVSGWVRCPDRAHVLLIKHRKLGLWLQPGGHVEAEDRSLLAAAEREVREETRLEDLVPLAPWPFGLDIHTVPARGEAPEHDHFDVRFAFELRAPRGLSAARLAGLVQAAPDEVEQARWVSWAELPAFSHELSVLRSCERLRQLEACASA
jgi:8-oxo-dGTP pyrophosphatase MutT (NUDIX family)